MRTSGQCHCLTFDPGLLYCYNFKHLKNHCANCNNTFGLREEKFVQIVQITKLTCLFMVKKLYRGSALEPVDQLP